MTHTPYTLERQDIRVKDPLVFIKFYFSNNQISNFLFHIYSKNSTGSNRLIKGNWVLWFRVWFLSTSLWDLVKDVGTVTWELEDVYPSLCFVCFSFLFVPFSSERETEKIDSWTTEQCSASRQHVHTSRVLLRFRFSCERGQVKTNEQGQGCKEKETKNEDSWGLSNHREI